MNYKSVAQLNHDVLNWLSRLPSEIDLFVGVPRSGMLAAMLLGLHGHRRVTDLNGFLDGRRMNFGMSKRSGGIETPKDDRVQTVLIVDDSICFGAEMAQTRRALQGIEKRFKLFYGAVYATPAAKDQVDYYYEEVPLPRLFEWNLMHHPLLAQACVDIDGVLCRDPTHEENDDGDNYRRFLAGVPLLRKPSHRIGTLVTCRLEKYRLETTNWLSARNIQYDRLMMMDVPDMATRQAMATHGTFKGNVYRSSDAVVFIESSQEQASAIAQLSCKPVICLETGTSVTLGVLAQLRLNLSREKENLKLRLKRKAKGLLIATGLRRDSS